MGLDQIHLNMLVECVNNFIKTKTYLKFPKFCQLVQKIQFDSSFSLQKEMFNSELNTHNNLVINTSILNSVLTFVMCINALSGWRLLNIHVKLYPFRSLFPLAAILPMQSLAEYHILNELQPCYRSTNILTQMIWENIYNIIKNNHYWPNKYQ